MKNYNIIRIYFSKSYLTPHTEHYFDIINTEVDAKIRKLKRKGFDAIRTETIKG